MVVIRVKRKQNIMKLAALTIMVAFSFACDSELPGNGKGVGMSSGGYADAKIPDLPKVPKASFEQLTLMDLSAVRSTAGDGNKKVSISYSPPPLVRFVKLNICSVDTGDCMEHSEVFNRATLAGLPAGKLQITARACVEAKYSKDGRPCGPSQTITFINSEEYTPGLEDLYRQRDQLNASMDEYLDKIRGHVDEFGEELAECSKRNVDKAKAQALGAVVMSAMALGEKLIDNGIKEFLKDEPVASKAEADGKETSTVAEEAEKAEASAKADPKKEEEMEAKSEWWKGKKWDDLVSPPSDAVTSIEAYIKSIKIFGYTPVPKDFAISAAWADLLKRGSKPVDAVKFVGGSIVSLMTADKVIIPACMAERRLKTNNQAAAENLRAAAESLKEVEDAIVRLGGSL